MNIHTFDFCPSKEVLLKIAGLFSKKEGTCFLFSSKISESSKTSFLWLFPIQTISWGQSDQCFHTSKETRFPSTSDLFKEIQKTITFPDTTKIPKWVCFFSYEMGALSDRDVMLPAHPSFLAQCVFLKSLLVLEFDHLHKKTKIYQEDLNKAIDSEDKNWAKKIIQFPSFVQMVSSFPNVDVVERKIQGEYIAFEEYADKIEQAKQYVRNGDIYQVNLSHEIWVDVDLSAFEIFSKLTKENPAAFAAFMNFKDFAIISASPERFLKKENNYLETRPIKGTIPRGKNPLEDLKNQERLKTCEKEKAELAMITDLSRNDLGRISRIGSVRTDFSKIELCASVFHMHSKVFSELEREMHPIEIIRNCFPGGSITGCPKLRAQEIIFEIEKRARHIYTGSIGYFRGNGDFDLNIAIRTLMYIKNRVSVQLGGAIVADSDPRSEYEETFHKGLPILKALGVDVSSLL